MKEEEVEWPMEGLWGIHHAQIMLVIGLPLTLCITEHLYFILLSAQCL